MKRIPITEQWLEKSGWDRQLFFYAIGGGEDENDCVIFVKDGIALRFDYTRNYFLKADSIGLTYADGFPDDDVVYYIDEL